MKKYIFFLKTFEEILSDSEFNNLKAAIMNYKLFETFTNEKVDIERDELYKMLNKGNAKLNADYYHLIETYKKIYDPTFHNSFYKIDFILNEEQLNFMFYKNVNGDWYDGSTTILSNSLIEYIKSKILYLDEELPIFISNVKLDSVKDLLMIEALAKPTLNTCEDLENDLENKSGQLYLKLHVNIIKLFKTLYIFHEKNPDQLLSKYFKHVGLNRCDDGNFSIIEALLIHRFFQKIEDSKKKLRIPISYRFNSTLLFIYGDNEEDLLKNLKFIFYLSGLEDSEVLNKSFIMNAELGVIGHPNGILFYNTLLKPRNPSEELNHSRKGNRKMLKSKIYESLDDFNKLY